jgi:membrane-associated PAP2 superfamily phosphatase
LRFVYSFGIYPAWLVVIPAMVIITLSYFIKPLKAWRNNALYLVITLAIGAGFIVNIALKNNWGRPRPQQVIEFGGVQEFRPFYEPNFFHSPEPSHSFPCGHCTMGFYFFAFVFLGMRLHKKWLIYSGWVLAIGLGTLLSITRMAQGGHFFSDVLFSALIMWLTALVCDWLINEEMV